MTTSKKKKTNIQVKSMKTFLRSKYQKFKLRKNIHSKLNNKLKEKIKFSLFINRKVNQKLGL